MDLSHRGTSSQHVNHREHEDEAGRRRAARRRLRMPEMDTGLRKAGKETPSTVATRGRKQMRTEQKRPGKSLNTEKETQNETSRRGMAISFQKLV